MEDIVKQEASKIGYEHLKEEQLAVIMHFMEGMDCFVVLPTGFGKSLCFALLSPVFDIVRSDNSAITVVVSPLVSIIESMAKDPGRKGIKAEYVVGETKDANMKQGIKEGKYSIVFFTPESLLNSGWRSMLLSAPYQQNLVAFVIDEAHTVYKW